MTHDPLESMSTSTNRRSMVACTIALSIMIITAGVAGCGENGSPSGRGPTLKVGVSGGTLDYATKASYIEPFQADGGTGATLVASNMQLSQVEAQNQARGTEWDLVELAGDEAVILRRKGYLAELPPRMTQRFIAVVGADSTPSFGLRHGSIANVVACNMERMKTCPKSMAEFYDTERFPQRRTFPAISSAAVLATAQVASGIPAAATAQTPLDMAAAFEQLEGIRDRIEVFWRSGDEQEEIMRSGRADMGVLSSNHAYRLAQSGMKLQINWAGGGYEPRYLAVVKGAPHERKALRLLSWIANNPEAQADWAQATGASVPHPKAMSALPRPLVEQLADSPDNYYRVALPNTDWYARNVQEVEERYRDFVRSAVRNGG